MESINGIRFYKCKGSHWFVKTSQLPVNADADGYDKSVEKIHIDYIKNHGWMVTNRFARDSDIVFDTLAEAKQFIVDMYRPQGTPTPTDAMIAKRQSDMFRELIQVMIDRDKQA
jgi:hypothetical protein